MTNKTWQANLKARLQAQGKTETPARLALVGIGHELCGDDAVGVRVAELLKPFAEKNEHLLMHCSGTCA